MKNLLTNLIDVQALQNFLIGQDNSLFDLVNNIEKIETQIWEFFTDNCWGFTLDDALCDSVRYYAERFCELEYIKHKEGSSYIAVSDNIKVEIFLN